MKKIISLAVAVLMIVGCLALVACSPKIADNTEYYDAITKTLKLTKSYEGKSYIEDGIGPAALAQHTDGDTSRFLLDDGRSVTMRYYSIDTPESTGGVEKWGAAASAFVKEKLTTATDIVLEATTVPASTETYGRYLGYVWYKSEGDTDFRCLNLEVVENGFSDNKGINTSEYPYYDYFKKANDFARSIKLRLYSDLEDPLYSTDPIPMTIKAFWENTEAFYNEEMQVGSKVEVYAYLTDLKISNSGTYTFVAEEYDAETGKTYQINVYAGYVSASASAMKIGHMYRFVGSIQKYSGQYQISGIVYDSLYQQPQLSYVTQRNYYYTFDNSISYNSNFSATNYSDVTVVSATVEEGVLTIVGSAQKKTGQGLNQEAETFTFTVKVADDFENTFKAGDKFSVTGLQLEKDSGNITIIDFSDINLK